MSPEGNGLVPAAWWWDEAVPFMAAPKDQVVDPRAEQGHEHADRDTH